jgi:hypothetical protein
MAVTEERIVEYRCKQKTDADSHRDYYEDRWIKNWQLYRNTRQTRRYKMQPWNSNAQIPDAFRVVETMLPQHVLGMFRNPNWFSVEAPTAAGQTYQEMVRSLLLQGWRKADGFRKTVEGMKMGTILGHFCPKTTWKQEIGELVIQDTDYTLTPDGEPMSAGYVERTIPYVTHNGPQVEFPDLFNLWQDPTGQGMFWIERIPTSFTVLEETNRKFSGNLYKNMGKLKAEIAMSPSTTRYTSGSGNYDQPLATTVDGVPEQFADDAVELWQCWGYVPPTIKRYDDTQWRLQIIANEKVLLRDEPAPTHDHRAPYDNVQSVPIPGQVYGDSVLSYVGDLIELRSEFENMRRDEAMLNIYQTHWIDGRLQIRGQDMLKTPGGAIRLTPATPDMNVAQSFGTIPRQPVLPEAYNESNIKEHQIDQTAGTFNTFQGQAFGGRTSASEVSAIMNVGTARFQLATMWMDESFKKRVLTRMFRLYQSKLTTPEMVTLVGQPDIQGEIDFTDLRYDVDVYVDSGLYGSMDAQQAQNITQLYQVLLTNPEAAAYIDIGKLAKSLNYRMGLSGTSDSFIRSEDEAQQIIQAQQQAALAAQAAGEGSAR